jgi:hypothetical protein
MFNGGRVLIGGLLPASKLPAEQLAAPNNVMTKGKNIYLQGLFDNNL